MRRGTVPASVAICFPPSASVIFAMAHAVSIGGPRLGLARDSDSLAVRSETIGV